MTQTDDAPEPIAQLVTDSTVLVLFDDEEYIVLADGAPSCSEHGPLNRAHDINVAQCDHDYDPDTQTLPGFPVSSMVGTLSGDRSVQREALDRVAEDDPEAIIEIAEQMVGREIEV